MSHVTVTLFVEQGLDRNVADETATLFQRFAGPVKVMVSSRPVEIGIPPGKALSCDAAFTCLNLLRTATQIPTSDCIFLLTKTPNEENLFFASAGEARHGFGHVGDFRWVTTAPTGVIVSRYIIEFVFGILLTEAGMPSVELVHDESRGCLFDYCSRKWELNLALRTADICGDCMETLRMLPNSDALLKQTVGIMETTRRLALNTGPYLQAEMPFQRWPFPVAVTRHKATQVTDPLHRFLALLDHFDCLVRYFFLVRETLSERKPVLVDRPSLGWWVNQLASSLKEERSFRDIVSISQEEKVVQLRNEKRGHGWVAAESFHYAPDVERLERVLGRIEEELEPFLDSHRLVIPRHIELREEGYVVEGEQLVGSNLLHPQFRITLEHDPRSHGLSSQGRVFVADSEMREFRSIFPYLRSDVCPTCNHQRILITDGGNQYIDTFIGHRVSFQEGVPRAEMGLSGGNKGH